jgi:quinol monooxygenase YgiN
MIYVIATIDIEPGKRETFLDEFRKIVPLVQAEQGCLGYEPTVDVPTSIAAQGDVRENAVTVVEKWESIEALESHLMAPHMMDYRAKVKSIVQGSKLAILQPTG